MLFSWPVTEQKCEILGDINLEFLAFIYEVAETSDITIAAALKKWLSHWYALCTTCCDGIPCC